MPSFGRGSLWDIAVIGGFILFLLASRRMRMPGGLAVGICFVVAGILAVLSGRVAFRHYSVYTGSPARFIGLLYVIVGACFFAVAARQHRNGPPPEEHAAEEPQ